MTILSINSRKATGPKDSVKLAAALRDAEKRDPAWNGENTTGQEPVAFAAWSDIFQKLIVTASTITGMSASDWVEGILAGEDGEDDLRDNAHLLTPIIPKLSHVTADGAATMPRNSPQQAGSPSQLKAIEDMLFRIVLKFADITDVLVALHLKTGTDVTSDVGLESWGLARRVSQHASTRRGKRFLLILCVVTRSLSRDMGVEVQDIREAAKASDCCLELKALDEMSCVRYSAQVLSNLSQIHVRDVALPPELVQLLKDRAGTCPTLSCPSRITPALTDDTPSISMTDYPRPYLSTALALLPQPVCTTLPNSSFGPTLPLAQSQRSYTDVWDRGPIKLAPTAQRQHAPRRIGPLTSVAQLKLGAKYPLPPFVQAAKTAFRFFILTGVQ